MGWCDTSLVKELNWSGSGSSFPDLATSTIVWILQNIFAHNQSNVQVHMGDDAICEPTRTEYSQYKSVLQTIYVRAICRTLFFFRNSGPFNFDIRSAGAQSTPTVCFGMPKLGGLDGCP